MQSSEHHFGTQVSHCSVEQRLLISTRAATWCSSLVSEHFSNNPSIFPAPLPCTEVSSSLFGKRGIEAGRFREKTAAHFACPIGAARGCSTAQHFGCSKRSSSCSCTCTLGSRLIFTSQHRQRWGFPKSHGGKVQPRELAVSC